MNILHIFYSYQFSQSIKFSSNHARMNLTGILCSEGAPAYEQKELQSSGKRCKRVLRMGAG